MTRSQLVVINMHGPIAKQTRADLIQTKDKKVIQTQLV